MEGMNNYVENSSLDLGPLPNRLGRFGYRKYLDHASSVDKIDCPRPPSSLVIRSSLVSDHPSQ